MIAELRTLYDDSADGILVADSQTKHFFYANRAICQMLGYTKAELCALSVTAIHPQKALAEVLEQFEGMRERRIKRAPAVPCLRKDGSVVYADISAHHAVWRQQPCMVGVFRDVTALREQEDRYRLIADNVTDVIFTTRLADIVEPAMLIAQNDPADLADVVLGDRWRFTYISPSVQRLTGYPAEEVATLPLRRLLTPESFAYVRNLLRAEFSHLSGRTAALPPRHTFEVEIVAKDGSRRWCEVALTFLRSDTEELVGAVGVVRDITERREATEAVQKEQALLRRLLDIHERERQLMAYEIHDGFTQQLAGALLHLQGFRENLSRGPMEAWKSFDTAAKLIARAVDDARRLISGLRPPILDEAGIVEAVDYLVCENQRADGPKIEFTHDVAFDRLAPPLETAIFRIVQESLHNACRHSRSARIHVELVQRDQTVYFEVSDWGVGFDPSRAAEQRFGLQGIRERVRLLGGQIAIESAPGEGTRICVELPIVVPDS